MAGARRHAMRPSMGTGPPPLAGSRAPATWRRVPRASAPRLWLETARSSRAAPTRSERSLRGPQARA